MPSGINAELAPPQSRPSLRKRFKCLLSSLAMLAIGQVYADCTLTWDGCITATTPLLNRFGDSIDYQFGSAYSVTVPAGTIPTGIGLSNYAWRKTVTYSSSGVDTSWVDFHLLGMQGGTLDATFSSFGEPASLTCCPRIKATVAENRTSAERSCSIIITMTTVTEWSGQTSTTSSSYQWKFVIKQAAGSANVTVTLDSNGGTDAMPKKIFKYKNGGWTYRTGGMPNGYTFYYSGYKQTLMDPPVGGVTEEQSLQFINSWVVPTTSRPGFIFDGWYTVSTYNDANNIKISFASGEETKPSAKVEKIIAHWKFEPPQNFTATQDLTDRVSLSWEPVANSTATYFIYRSEEDECPSTPYASTSAQQYDDTMTDPGRTYYYWIKAHGTDNGLNIESDIGEPVIGYRALERVAAPTTNFADGETFMSSSKKVTIKCETSGATIYYTTDGSEPDETSPVYSKAFSVYDTTTIKAIAVKDGMRSSDVVIATIVKIVPATPNEALDTDIQLTTGGTGEWSGITDASAKVGGDYLKSGVISDDERTWLSLTVSGKGTFSFWWRTSCEEDDSGAADWDAAIFTAPDANQKEIRRDGIMSYWEKVSVTFATVGEHILKWTYKKDESDADGDDCLYLDGFSWTPSAPDPIVWTVTFNLNGADAQDGTSPRSITDAAAIGTLPAPTRDGYTFAGWWTEASGGTEVTATTTVAADMTLFAHWTENLPPPPAYTETTPVPVRHDWLVKYSGILSAAGNDYEAAAMRQTGKKDGKGNALCVWHDYLAGTDPANANSVFKAKVEFVNGLPKVGWEPDLNDNGRKSERFYKVFGKKTLAANENWTRLADETAQKDYNFFKVTVNMEETPDTEEELKFGDGTADDGQIDDPAPSASTFTIENDVLKSVDLNGATSVVIPDGVATISPWAFAFCRELKSITMPSSVTSIGDQAFMGCTKLESIFIPDGVEYIGASAFAQCEALRTVSIPGSVKDIGGWSGQSFSGCKGLTNVVFRGEFDELTLGSDTFWFCTSLKKIALPEGARRLDRSVFMGCWALTDVSIPSTMTNRIDYATFANCIALTNIVVSPNNYSYSSLGGMLFDKKCENLVYAPHGIKDLTIPATMKSFDANAFSDYFDDPGDPVRSNFYVEDGNAMFASVEGLLTDKAGKTLLAFPSGRSVANVPASIRTIGDKAFLSCVSLVDVTIPVSVTHIGSDAFMECMSLVRVNINGALDDYDVSVYEDFYVPRDLVTYVTSKWTGPTDTWCGRRVVVVE